ncbi:MAG: NUDIX hydrolase [Syntrophobacteraceae bacterium]
MEYHLDAVAVLPVINENSILMVRVKRPIINDMTLELPAGGVEKGENPMQGASRELAEETGIVITDFDRYMPMPPIAVSSARMPRLSYVFRINISEEEFAQRQPHDNEIHSISRIPITEIAKMMASGKIYVSVPLAILGIFLTSRQLSGSQHMAALR